MKRILRVIGYIFLGAAILLVAANQFIGVTGEGLTVKAKASFLFFSQKSCL